MNELEQKIACPECYGKCKETCTYCDEEGFYTFKPKPLNEVIANLKGKK